MKICLLSLFTVVCICCNGFGQVASNLASPRHFDGPYLGIAAGSQNLFGGSFVNGIDVLAQESRFVTDLFAGYRAQLFKAKLLLGFEFQVGFTDGNLMHINPEQQLEISYKNKTQSGIGLTFGTIFGSQKNFLIFGYLNETTRKFDVSIKEQGKRYRQKDEQGMLKYGLGLEARFFKKVNVRLALGRLRVDFGDQVTNINVEDKWDIMGGFAYQF